MIKRESGPYYTAYDLLQERDSKGIPPISFKFRAICSYNRLDIDLSYRIEEFFKLTTDFSSLTLISSLVLHPESLSRSRQDRLPRKRITIQRRPH